MAFHTVPLRSKNLDPHSPRAVLVKNILYWITYFMVLLGIGFVTNLLPKHWYFNYSLVGVACIAIAVITYWFLKRDGKRFADIGLQFESRTIARFLLGFLTGGFILFIIIAIILVFQPVELIRVDKTNMGLILLSSGVTFLGAWHQEIAFRSYPVQTLQPRFGVWNSQLIIALAFGLYHVVAGFDLKSALIGTVLWSLLYGFSAVLSGGIALPTGMHTALNIGQGLIGTHEALWQISPTTLAEKDWQKKVQVIGELTTYLLIMLSVGMLAFLIRRKRAHRI